MRILLNRSLLILFYIFIFGQFCSRQPVSGKNQSKSLEGLAFTENTEFDEIAKLMGAKPLSGNSPLNAIAKTRTYQKYFEEVNSIWDKFEKSHLSSLRGWVSGHSEISCSNNVFYPFSGPDLLHALTLYPEARVVRMLALERLGGLPDPDIKKPEREAKKLSGLINAVRSSLDYFYFITSKMSTNIGNDSYSGVAAILLFAFARLDYQVIDFYPIEVSPEGLLKKKSGEVSNDTDAVAFFYRKSNEKQPKVLLYFRGDLSDEGLKKKPGLKKYLGRIEGPATLLKAASYLMYERSFDDMRSLILSRSKCVVSDVSGIPYSYFLNDNWDISLYGAYRGPISHFKIRFDPMLYSAINTSSKGVLPFDFGYRKKEGFSHIIFSQRKPDSPLNIPSYDGSSKIGETTYWDDKNKQLFKVFRPAPEDVIGGPVKKNKK